MDYFVRSIAIRNWAQRYDARVVLPQLIRRLATSTVRDISEIDFPAHESVQRNGFDGTITCGSGDSWVPSGNSVWELSIERNVKSKADKDFSDRTSKTPRKTQEVTTYVAITARHWKNKRKWEVEQSKSGHWKGVRAYDCDNIEQWLESSLAVSVWFGGQLGSRPPGVDDLGAKWKSISGCSTRELLPSIFLAGRKKSAQKLREWLAGPPSSLAFACRSPLEVIDFVAAWAAALDDVDRVSLESRAILIEDFAAWRALRDVQVPAVLIVDPATDLSPQEISRGIRSGHHVLVATEPASREGQQVIELERAAQTELTDALEECGYSPLEAEQLSRAAGGSLAILKNKLTRFGAASNPVWSESVPHGIITACLLLGGWSESNAADRVAFEKLSGMTYESCESQLQKLSTCRDSLLLHAAKNWRLVSKDDAWTLFGTLVPPSALRLFKSLSVEILADDDPQFRLPDNERSFAAWNGHVSQYSETVKRHVAETVALLGAMGDAFEASSSTNIQAVVRQIVADVLSPSATWDRWASLGGNLYLLAEASPSEFLSAVRADLSKQEPELLKLFVEGESTFFSRCNHAGLLWALEVLAWSRIFLADVTDVLVTLTERDPGGKWGNRPHCSLSEIFSYWMPQTTATCEERLKILDLMLQKHRPGIWQILLNFLPSIQNSCSHPTQRPYWRNWGNEWVRGARREESHQFLTGIAERLLDLAGTDPNRWVKVFENLNDFPEMLHTRLERDARALSTSQLTDNERRLLSDSLSDLIRTHRQHHDANWALPKTFLDEMQQICDCIEPQSAVMKSVWLFESWPRQFFDTEDNHTEQQARLEETRKNAAREVSKSQGFSGLKELAVLAESSWNVGYATANGTGDEFLQFIIPVLLETSDQKLVDFAKGFVSGRWRQKGWAWVDEVLPLCAGPMSRSHFLCILEFGPEAWNRATAGGLESMTLYWQQSPAFNPELQSDEVEFAVERLLKHGRASFAIDILGMALHKERSVKSRCFIEALEALRTQPHEKVGNSTRQSLRHGIQEIIKELQVRTDVDEQQMLAVEFAYLGFLDEEMGYGPKTIVNHIIKNPKAFVELLGYCFKSTNDEEDENPVSRDPNVAKTVFRLLHGWSHIPGARNDGTIDEQVLRIWCNEGRNAAIAVGQLDMFDNYFGQMIASSPEDGDGTWPCRSVRQVATEIGSDSLASGIVCGIINSRGVVCRGTGGDQERVLTTKYRSYADAIRFDHPFVAKALDHVAESYSFDARDWDERNRWED